jgi:serine/threonine protein kinase
MWFILAHMAIPSKIGRYEVKSELGRGGMATVYRAYDPSFDREVAIKVLPREMLHDPQFRSRFERELKIVAGLEHPAIVPVYDVGEEDGQPYFVMRFMTGGSLSAQIANGNFSLQDTARIISKIAQGLAYAHKKGIIHRDLKPDNILFDDAGEPFISDFGVAKLSGSTGSLTGSGVIGTPAYMSPEQAQGSDIDSRSDVYGLGVIVFHMLSGQQPYNSDTPMGVVVKHITEPVPEILKVLPGLPPEVDKFIKTALAKDRNKRYGSAIDLAKALNLIAFGNEGSLTASTNGLRTNVFETSPVSSSRTRTGIVIAGIVLLVAAAGFFLLRNQLSPVQQSTPTPTPAPVTASTVTSAPISTAVVQPTESVSSPSPFAPACAAGQVKPPPPPAVADTNKVCVKKVPYTAIEIPQGATFESLDPKFSCKVETTNKGKTILSCTGTQLLSFDLKVCQIPPGISSADAGKCPKDAIFNPAAQCCAAAPPKDAGCTVFKVDIRGCP